MKKRSFVTFALISLIQMVCLIPAVFAGNFSLDTRAGFGAIKYEEQTSSVGTNREAESTQNAVLLGLSGEYSFSDQGKFFTAVTGDWTIGAGDREKWRDNSIAFQTNDMKVFGQFYDVRLGYKNNINNFYYRAYLSGGWDGMHFRRRHFIVKSVGTATGPITEDFSLWRTGGGVDLGYKLGSYMLNGKAGYGYYINGEVENSAYPNTTWDTNGTRMDFNIGVSKEIQQNIKFHIGFIYTLIELDEDIKTINSTRVVFPNSTTKMMFGVLGLTCAF